MTQPLPENVKCFLILDIIEFDIRPHLPQKWASRTPPRPTRPPDARH